ncbi:MAG TPA: hypothetical protein VH478_21395 [Trebonia sp.]|jgi:hypothetical protein|nr:hypothetical protein [Trebonia sp.]
MTSKMRNRGLIVTGAVVAAYTVGTAVARRMGYAVGASTVVKCRAGHVFSTIWIPGASVKALKLGPWRYQWCPVGRHMALVRPMRDTDLTREARDLAASRRDVRVP